MWLTLIPSRDCFYLTYSDSVNIVFYYIYIYSCIITMLLGAYDKATLFHDPHVHDIKSGD